MAITFNGAPIGDVLFYSVNIAHMTVNGTEVLPQTVYFVEGYAENIINNSGNKTGSHTGDISFYGGSNPLITASAAKPSTGNVSANDNTYGFGFSASVNGLTSVSAIYKLYDNSYQDSNRTLISSSDSSSQQVNVSITVPFACTLTAFGYVQCSPSSNPISQIVFNGSTYSLVTGQKYVGNAIKQTVSKSYTAGQAITLGLARSSGTSAHYLGDLFLTFSLTREAYAAWKNSKNPPVHLNSSASIVRN